MSGRAAFRAVLLALAASLCLAPTAGAAPAWFPVGTGANPVSEDPNADSMGPSLADLSGNPRIAWRESAGSSGYQIRASRYDGTLFDPRPWRRILNPPNPDNNNVPDPISTSPEGPPSLAMVPAPDDPSRLEPWIAWKEYPAVDAGGIRVSRFAGGRWQRVGTVLNDSNISLPATNIATIGGQAYVAWAEAAGPGNPYKIRVKRFVAGPDEASSAWQEVGTAGSINISSTQDATNPDIADVGGVPYVAWTENDGTNDEIRVKRFDGTSWVEVGSGASPINRSPTENGDSPSLASVGGVPYVAWKERNELVGLTRIYSRRISGISWGDLEQVNPSEGRNADSPSLASIGGVAYVAWIENNGTNRVVGVSRRAGDFQWQQVGGASPLNRQAGEDAYDPEMASIGGAPVVAWAEDTGAGGRQIQVSAYGDPSTNVDRPRIAGIPKTGEELTCAAGSWTGTPTFTYLWDRAPRTTTADDDPAWTPIDGASGDRYTVQAADEGLRVRCRVVAIGADFSAREAVSASLRADAGPPVNVTPPRVTGTPIANPGNLLTCEEGEWTNGPQRSEFEFSPGDFTYEWFRDGQSIGASKTFRRYRTKAPGEGLGTPDDDNKFTCQVTASNDVGSSGPVRAANTLHVVGGPPVNRLSPLLEVFTRLDRNQVGRTARCNRGEWRRDYSQYTFSWYRNGDLIAGETGRDYTTKVDDLGKNLQCGVVSTNPVGPSPVVRSNQVLITLPIGTEDAEVFQAGARNEFDPKNLLAMSKQYKETVAAINVERFTSAVEADEERCRSASGVPAQAPKLSVEDFFSRQERVDGKVVDVPPKVSRRIRDRGAYRNFCALLLRNRQAVAIGPQGVTYTAAVFRNPSGRGTPETACIRDADALRQELERQGRQEEVEAILSLQDQGLEFECPDMPYFFPPVDPNNPGDLTLSQQARLDPVTPVRVLWDYGVEADSNFQVGKVDAECPADSPVVRTMLNRSNNWTVRAVIVTRASARTGIFPSGKISFKHFSKYRGFLRKAQPFACRTSLQPPPDPEQGPCLTKGTIGRVQVQGDLCPVYLRALDPKAIAGLPPEVYAVLKEMAGNIALHRANPEGVPVPLNPTSGLRAFTAASAADTATVATYANTASSYASIDDPNLDPLQNIPPKAVPDVKAAVEATKGKFDPEKANFSLDQIYWGTGPVKVNGVGLLPDGSRPTLLVPTEAGNAIQEVNSAGKTVAAVKAMTINNPAADLALGCARKPTLEGCALPLAKQQPLKAVLDEAKSSAQAALTNQLDLKSAADNLRAKAAALTKPFKLTDAKADVKLNNDGTATLTAETEVPLLKDTSGKGFTVKMTLKGDLDGRVTLQGVKVGPVNAKLGGVNLKGVVVEYNQGDLTLQGQILFPPTGEGIRIEKFGINKDGKLTAFVLNYVAGAGSGINIGPGVFINEVGGGFKQIGPPFILNATVGVSAGPSLGGGCSVAGIRSTLDLALGGQPEVVADILADVMLMCFPLGQLKFHFDSRPFVSVDGQLGGFEADGKTGKGMKIGPLKVKAGFYGAIAPPRWQLGASAELSLEDLPIVGTVGPIGGEFVVSNKGAVGCVRITLPWPLPDFAGGLGVRFIGGVPPLTPVQLIAGLRAFLGCDLSDYRSLPRRIVASGAQAGASSFTLPKDASDAVLSIEGAGGAPRVRLRSPGGKVYDFSNATATAKIDNAMGQIVEKEDRTMVILGRAETGTWTADPSDGSPAIARIRISRILPQPKVSGKVSGLGGSRVLSYSIAPLGARRCGSWRKLRAATRCSRPSRAADRSLRFTPGEAKGTKRTIAAKVTQDDLPRGKPITVASYRAAIPAIGRPGKVNLKRRRDPYL